MGREPVAILSDRVGPGSGTAGIAFDLAEGLASRGFQTEVWANGVTARPRGAPVLGSPGSAPRQGRLRIGLDRIAGCPVLRCSGGVHEAWRAVLRTDRTRFVRAIGPSRTSRAEARAVREATVLVCNSFRAAGEVVAHHGRSLDDVRIVRNGVDLRRFGPDPQRRTAARARWGVPADGRVALFVAHGWFRKGLRAAVRGFAEAARPSDRLVVMGRDSQSRRRLAEARAHLGDRLVVAADTDAPRALPGGDVLVHPTRYDASANVVLQAMACGVPPVTTLRDGAAEIIEDRRLIVANPDDSNAIAAAIRHAWEAARLGGRCHEQASRWPTSRMVEGVAAIVEELQHG